MYGADQRAPVSCNRRVKLARFMRRTTEYTLYVKRRSQRVPICPVVTEQIWQCTAGSACVATSAPPHRYLNFIPRTRTDGSQMALPGVVTLLLAACAVGCANAGDWRNGHKSPLRDPATFDWNYEPVQTLERHKLEKVGVQSRR